MPSPVRTFLRDRLPLFARLERLPRQLLRRSPFAGGIQPARVPLLAPGSGRPSLPFPHPWNYRNPLEILEAFYWGSERDDGWRRHTRYLEVPGFAPVMVTRDPRLIQAISAATGAEPGQFDRDTLPTGGIARATGADTLLYANGPVWKRQKKLVAPSFARSTLFQPEQFHEFEGTLRQTVVQRLELVRRRVEETGGPLRVELEPEIKALMLEMLVSNFFGVEVTYAEIRERYVPAIDCVIQHIVRDTVVNKLGIPLGAMPSVTRGIADAKKAAAAFEQLTNLVISGRREGKGLWKQFKSDAPDEALRSNVRVFLAGALEATTSYASWALWHLARNTVAQERLYQEVRGVAEYTPQTLEGVPYLGQVLNETLRLTPALYFHPRKATVDTWVEGAPGERLLIPKGTHILLDVWHANRHEDHWGTAATGHPALAFAPERWESTAAEDHGAKGRLHFGFGHGPRFCPGKNLGQLEVALVVGACVKLFRLDAIKGDEQAKAGVSTKPRDGVLVELSIREQGGDARDDAAATAAPPATERSAASGCPFARRDEKR